MSTLKEAEAAQAAAEKLQKQEIGEQIYALMAFLPGITEDKWAKLTGMILESMKLDELQELMMSPAGLIIKIHEAHKYYNAHKKEAEAPAPAQATAAAQAAAAASPAKAVPAATAPPAKAPLPQHKQRQHQQQQRKLDPREYPPLGKNAERAKGPAHHQGKQWQRRPTRLQRAMTTTAMAVSTVAAIVSDFKSLPQYVGSTLEMLWRFPKKKWFEQNLFKYAVKPFYGMLWGSCPEGDDSYKFLLFPKGYHPIGDECTNDLKTGFSSLVVVSAFHCIFNNAALGRLGIQCMFNDKNEIVEQIKVFMKVAIKRYIAEYQGSYITNRFKDCVQYIRAHGNVKDVKNPDTTIDLRVTAVEKLFAEATTDKTEATIDELCNRLAELTDTIARMEKTQEQTARRLDEVHAEVVVLRKEANKVVDAANDTVAMLAKLGIV